MGPTLAVSLILLSVTVSGGPGNPRDWLGVFKQGSPNSANLSWVYLACGNQSCPKATAKEGTVQLALPLEDGNYEIRFLSATGARTYATLAVIDPGVSH